jgi:predicted RNase H-like HicB family nuclease
MLQPSRQTARRCCVLLSQEDDGYCVRAADLAGVVSEGDSVDEALHNLKDASAGAIESYEAHGESIPWQVPPREPEENEQRVWIELDG